MSSLISVTPVAKKASTSHWLFFLSDQDRIPHSGSVWPKVSQCSCSSRSFMAEDGLTDVAKGRGCDPSRPSANVAGLYRAGRECPKTHRAWRYSRNSGRTTEAMESADVFEIFRLSPIIFPYEHTAFFVDFQFEPGLRWLRPSFGGSGSVMLYLVYHFTMTSTGMTGWITPI